MDTYQVTFGSPRGDVQRAATGLIVGVIGVRSAFEDEAVQDDLGRICRIGGSWIVHAMNGFFTLGIYRRFDDALVVADDLSRFAPSDLDLARTVDDFEMVFGRGGSPIRAWIDYGHRLFSDPTCPRLLGFREWERQQLDEQKGEQRV
jgi:hypothetical protein